MGDHIHYGSLENQERDRLARLEEETKRSLARLKEESRDTRPAVAPSRAPAADTHELSHSSQAAIARQSELKDAGGGPGVLPTCAAVSCIQP